MRYFYGFVWIRERKRLWEWGDSPSRSSNTRNSRQDLKSWGLSFYSDSLRLRANYTWNRFGHTQSTRLTSFSGLYRDKAYHKRSHSRLGNHVPIADLQTTLQGKNRDFAMAIDESFCLDNLLGTLLWILDRFVEFRGSQYSSTCLQLILRMHRREFALCTHTLHLQ